jgi:hypothetical protein
MKQLLGLVAAFVLVVGAGAQQGKQVAWTALFDGKNLDNWTTVGNANWKLTNGIVEANTGNGFLLSKGVYKDFELRAEVWVDEAANSGVFLRCSNTQEITQDNAYEVNLYDKRPDQTYATGAIVNVSKPSQPMTAAGKWNTFEIRAQGTHLEVTLNGVKTVDVQDSKFASGPIGLQAAAGTVRFRLVQIRPL